MDDVRLHPFWIAKNRDGYYEAARKYIRLANGNPITKAVATRWFNTNDLLFKTIDDIWIHRDKEELWWTQSLSDTPIGNIIDDPNPRDEPTKIYVYHKKCAPWSSSDKTGRPLRWNALHAKARDFLSTETTFQRLSDKLAEYTLALINGDDLSKWHESEEWRLRAIHAKKFPGVYGDARKKTIARMINTMINTVAQSGDVYLKTNKEKNNLFNNDLDLENHINELWDSQEQRCALSGLKLLDDEDNGDHQLRYSLDRIDSSKHYERGNLQLVCKFLNKWKGASDNDEFLRLLQLLKLSQTELID